MKRILLTFAVAIMATSLYAKNPVKEIKTPASDNRITFVGRTMTNGNDVSFDWSGVYVRVSFKGNYLAIKAKDTKKNYYNIWVDSSMDQKPYKVINTSKTDSLIVIANAEDFKALYPKNKKAQNDVHSVIIQKRTEGEQGKTTIEEFITNGEILAAQPIKPRLIEFVGDSYTCGFGSENSIKTDPFKPETENSNLSYAPIVARFFDADYVLVSHSGMGIARNYNDNKRGTHMPDLYLRTFDEDKDSKWDAANSKIKPNLTVIYLCTNDFSTQRQPSIGAFTDNYIRLMKSIKSNYGEDHPILCVAGSGNELMPEYIRTAVEKSGLKNVKYMFLTKGIHNMDSELGACSHPNYKGHIKKAFAIIPYVSTITGWDIQPKLVK